MTRDCIGVSLPYGSGKNTHNVWQLLSVEMEALALCYFPPFKPSNRSLTELFWSPSLPHSLRPFPSSFLDPKGREAVVAAAKLVRSGGGKQQAPEEQARLRLRERQVCQ